MNGPFHWSLVVVAAVAITASLVGRTDLAVAVPTAALAVTFSGLALWDAVLRAPPATRTRVTPVPDQPRMVRVLFHAGREGREGIVHLLDYIDRRGAHPQLPVRRPAELRRLVNLPANEFRREIASRLDELETTP